MTSTEIFNGSTVSLRSVGFSTAEIEQFYCFALIVTVASLLGFAAIFFLRAGMGDSPIGIGSLFVSSVLPPWACAWAALRFGGSAHSAACAGTVGLFIGILFPVLGLIGGRATGIPATLFLLFAVWEGRGHLVGAVRGAKIKIMTTILISVVLLLLLTAPMRFYLPEGLLLGLTSPDSYYHAALAQMVSHYGVFSIGADGLIYNHYHFLSHFLAAGLSEITGLTVPQIYLYWAAIPLKLDFIAAFTFACIFLYPPGAADVPTRTLWITLYAWLGASLINSFGTDFMLESESFTLGLALAIAALPLWLILMTNATPPRRTMIATTLIAILATLLCAAAKISAGFFGGIALAVVAWHHRAQPAIVALVGAGMVALAAFGYLYVMPRSSALAGASLSLMIVAYLQYTSWQTLASYLLPLTVIALFLCPPELTYSTGGGELRLTLKRGRNANLQRMGAPFWLDWLHRSGTALLAADGTTQFVFLSLLGCVVVLCTVPIGADMVFFSLILYGFAILLLPVTLASVNLAVVGRPLRVVIGILLAVNFLPLICNFVPGLHQTLIALQRAALNTSNDPPVVRNTIIGAIKAHKAPLYVLHEEIVASPRARLIAELSRLDHAAGGRLAVHVAPSATEVWSWLKGQHAIWCTTGHLVVPAETGIVEIRSVAPDAIERQCMPPGRFWYGYGEQQELHRTSALSDTQLCALARPLKVREIYRLISYSDLRRNSLISCP